MTRTRAGSLLSVVGCRIRITQGKGSKDRIVSFPESFKETLALHIEGLRAKGALYLFESVTWTRAGGHQSC